MPFQMRIWNILCHSKCTFGMESDYHRLADKVDGVEDEFVIIMKPLRRSGLMMLRQCATVSGKFTSFARTPLDLYRKSGYQFVSPGTQLTIVRPPSAMDIRH